MYYRIKNKLDAKAVAMLINRENLDTVVGERIKEIAETLDSHYGSLRLSHADGGYTIFFPTREIYEELIGPIRKLYNLDMNQSEYLDFIGEQGMWCEELYMFTEEALVLIYPKEM